MYEFFNVEKYFVFYQEGAQESSKSKAVDKENKPMKRIGSILNALKKSPISRSGTFIFMLQIFMYMYFQMKTLLKSMKFYEDIF